MFGLSRETLLLLCIMLIAVVIFSLCMVIEVDEIMMPDACNGTCMAPAKPPDRPGVRVFATCKECKGKGRVSD